MKRGLFIILCLFWTGTAHAQDAINLSTAVVHNSPADVASWPVTTKITRLTMLPEHSAAPGLSFDFSGHATWPDYTPPGWDGPIQYTVWAGVRINGVWHVSGIIQMWRERASTGAPILTNNNFAINWVYDSRWGEMRGYQPAAGEAMVFFLTAGNARGMNSVTSVRERSNVVMVSLPANDYGVFTFTSQQTDLLIDFGSSGIWTLTDASTYLQVNPNNPKTIVATDMDGNGIDELVVDFGAGIGIWIRWNGGAWGHLHSGTANNIVAGDFDNNGGKDLAIDFPGSGVWLFMDGTRWYHLHSQSPVLMSVANIDGGADDLVLAYDGGGVWILRNGTTWLQAHPLTPSNIVAGDFDGNGLGDIAFSFPGKGLWLFMNASTWVQVHSRDVYRFAAGDIDGNRVGDLVVDFGPGAGIWVLWNGTWWWQLHVSTSDQIVLADLDGNGMDDVLVNFSSYGGGVWVWANMASWIAVHPLGPDAIVKAKLN